jgi:hypothetical protein
MFEPPENSATAVLLPLLVTTTCLGRGREKGGEDGEGRGRM